MERLQRQSILRQRIRNHHQAGNPGKAKELALKYTVHNYLHDLGLSWDDLRGKRILDIGADRAEFAKASAQRGIDVISLDKDHEHYKTNTPPNFSYAHQTAYIKADASKLPFRNETFDLVISRSTFLYSDPRLLKLLREAKRVLRPGGEFRFTIISEYENYTRIQQTEPAIEVKKTEDSVFPHLFVLRK